MMLLLRRGGTRRLAMTARWLVIAALAITMVTALLYNAGRIGECTVTPDAYWNVREHCVSKLDALYLSTITRSTGILLGAAFAMVWRPRAIMRGPMRDRAGLLDLVALVGFAVLGLQFWFLDVATVDGADPWLFRGGFLVTAVATIMRDRAPSPTATRSPAGCCRCVRCCGSAPARTGCTCSTGRSTRSSARSPASRSRGPQFVVAMLVTVPITELSYRFLEMPIRKREFGVWWDSLRRRRELRCRAR